MNATCAVLAVLLLQVQSGSPRVEEPVRVEYVLLDVVAFDDDGQPVTDLTIDEFKLIDGGKKIPPESLDVLDLRFSASPPAGESVAGESVKVAVAPRYVLLLDLEDVDRAGVEKTYRQLDSFLDRAASRPGFTLAIHSLDGGDLTDGFVTVAAARGALARDRRGRPGGSDADVESWARTTGSSPGAGARRTTTGSGGIELTDLEERFVACGRLGEGGPGHDVVSAHACVREELALYLEYRYARTTGTLRELERLAYRFGEPSRPTFLLLVSPGFEIRPGRAAASLAREYLQPGSNPDTPEFPRTLETLPEPRSFEAEFRRVVHACVSARTVFHTFDMYTFGAEESRRADPAFGATTEKTIRLYGDARAESARGLATLAENTGGIPYSGKTLKPMAAVLDRTVFIYTLGYTSPEGKPGKYRKIKLQCRRKGVRLLHRAGYFGS
jgi:hypothetical protein